MISNTPVQRKGGIAVIAPEQFERREYVQEGARTAMSAR